MLSILTQDFPCAPITGNLSESERKNLADLMKRSEMPDSALKSLLPEFENELKLETPYRRRFFNVIFARVCARRVPLLILSLKHTKNGSVCLNPPVLIHGYDRKTKKVSFLTSENGKNFQDRERLSTDFVKEFVETSFRP